MTGMWTIVGSPGTMGPPTDAHVRRPPPPAIGSAPASAPLADSCATAIGHGVIAHAGPGGPVAVSEADERGCTDETDRALQPVADRLNTFGAIVDRIANERVSTHGWTGSACRDKAREGLDGERAPPVGGHADVSQGG